MENETRPPVAEVPHCYRHNGRETYVRCTRCDRPICPDCMRSAAVGHQCPDCVAEGNRSVRQAKTVLGGAPTATAAVTWAIIGVNVVAYLAQQANTRLTDEASMWPSFVAVNHEYYRFVTGAFLHASPLHILSNMWVLWVIGPQVERALGRARYLVLYLLSALGGSLLTYLVAPVNQQSVGASGAIFGLLAAYFIIARRLGVQSTGIVLMIVLNLVITFAIPGISWEAHVGGLITGAVLAAAYAYVPEARRDLVAWLVPIAVLAVIVVGTVARTPAVADTYKPCTHLAIVSYPQGEQLVCKSPAPSNQ